MSSRVGNNGVARTGAGRASLETLLESADLGLEVLHPGGLEITRGLGELCHIEKDVRVLDVASGTGESACFVAEHFGCQMVGVDVSEYMIQRARRKATERHLSVEFIEGDAHHLPFDDHTFEAVISECTMCLLDKEMAIGEMVRVGRSGGFIGMHDICWKADTPAHVRQKLVDLEGERPETLGGWKTLFEKAKLVDVEVVDTSSLIPGWIDDVNKTLGVIGRLKIFLKAIKKWGMAGYKAIRDLEKILQSEYMGYGIIVGKKP